MQYVNVIKEKKKSSLSFTEKSITNFEKETKIFDRDYLIGITKAITESVIILPYFDYNLNFKP